MQAMPQSPLHRYLEAGDGLRLHYLDFPQPGADLPVVCLPGLSRPAEDFETLAARLNAEGLRVLALDYRGRGDSQWDADWTHYDLDVEQDDILLVLEQEGVSTAAFVGTSRGGIHTMRLALHRPGLVRAAVLNDIGPEINLSGLIRIKRYVGKLPPLASMKDAIGLTRFTAGPDFVGVGPEDWERYARRTFVETPQGVVLRYDPALSHTLDEVKPEMEPLDYWREFEALAKVPVLTLRGANSDILSPDILERMKSAAPAMRTHIVDGQGHAPLLMDEATLSRVADFIRRGE
jgi:pimeloyl-ACP methyl ester carboxylesterase